MKSAIWTLILGLGLSGASALADPTAQSGIWIDPTGWIGQCFVCPDNTTSDCMDAKPIYIEVAHNQRVGTRHVTQFYPEAWSEETGLQYHGTLSMTVHYDKSDEAMAVVTCHWLREDGFGVLIVRQIRLRYTAIDGWSQVEILHEHSLFMCH